MACLPNFLKCNHHQVFSFDLNVSYCLPSGAFQPIPATNAPTMQMPPSPFPSATRPPSHGQQIGQQSTPQPPEFINHPQPQLGRPPAGFPPVSSSLNTASIPPMLPPPATGPTSQFGQQQPQQMGDWLPPTQQPGVLLNSYNTFSK